MRTLVGWLLWLFPARFRRRVGDDLLATFDERWKDTDGRWRIAVCTIVDLLRSAAGEWRSTLRGGFAAPLRHPAHRLVHASSFSRDARGWTPSRRHIMPNVRLAFRALAKTPLVTSVAALSLALGIGANTAIFSLFYRILLRPLPVPAPSALVNLAAPGPKPGSTNCGEAGPCDVVFSYPMFRDLERVQTTFTGIAAHSDFDANLAYGGEAMTGHGLLVSGSYFTVLGLRPSLGRLLVPSDDAVRGEPHVVVLAHDFWQTRFASAPDAIGQTMTVNGVSVTIVGVAPDGFRGTTHGSLPQVFAPIALRGVLQPLVDSGFENRRAYWLYLFARLRPGVSMAQADSAINQPYHQIVTNIEAPLETGLSAQTMARFEEKQIVVTPGVRGQSRLDDKARQPLTFLLALTAIVLVIACANIANLLLARSVARAGDMAIRLAIGAGRRDVIVQLLTESCLLGAFGGVLGLGVAYGTLVVIRSLLPMSLAVPMTLELDPTVLAFAAVLAIGTGLIFGLLPAMHGTRPDLVAALKNQAGQPSGGRRAARVRAGLVTAQITLSMLLLVGAGLFAKSLVNVSRVDLGFNVDRLVTFTITPVMNGYTPARALVLFNQVEDGLSALPGVTSVSATAIPLVGGDNWGTDVVVQGFDGGPGMDTSQYNAVDTDFFRTAGIPMMAGRDFTRADILGAPKVAIVNHAFVRKFTLEPHAIGARLRRGGPDSHSPFDTEIVGVVQDSGYSDVKEDIPPVLYTPYRQDKRAGAGAAFYVRTSGDPGALLHAIPGVVRALDATLPVDALRTMPQQVRENIAVDRTITMLAVAFAVLATLLAGIGLYGMLAYTVSQRTREIGLRMALGAAPASIAGLVLHQVARLTIVGAVLGGAAALLSGRYVESLLFRVQGQDATVTGGALIVLILVAASAGYLPAFRASRVDPMRALRQD